MKKEFKYTYEYYESIKELSEEQQKIIKASEDARSTSYSPYSNFKVGAAILLEDGTIIKGSNQENKAYPSGLCAERVALFSYGSQGHSSKIKMIAIAGGGDLLEKKDNFSPCGSCRQVMAEYSNIQEKHFEIILLNPDRSVTIYQGIHQLLPFIFGEKQL
ncbi:MAG: cytidine deaminase [Brumimicrobium sp.]